MSLPNVTPTEITEIDREHPYLGLQSFHEQDHGFFYGRDSEIQSLFRLVRRDVLSVLFGMSGLGKTSLLNAGLFPKLREALYLPVSIRLDFDASAPGLISQVKARVASEIENYRVDAPLPTERETLWEYFHKSYFWNQKNRLLTPVLVFDQLEELFTLGRGNKCVVPFLQELSDVIENHIPETVRVRMEESGEELSFSYDHPNVKVVFSLREDYLAHLEDLRNSIPSLSRSRYRLTRMNGERALEAVLLPGGRLLTRDVAEDIVRFAAGDTGCAELASLEVEPALLSLVCRELNSRRLKAGLSSITSALLSGSKDRIIPDFYEKNIVALDPGVRIFVEEHLLTNTGFRSTKALDDALQFPGVSKQAIETLVDHRLVRLVKRLGIQHVELIHDVLAVAINESRQRRHQEELATEEKERTQQKSIFDIQLDLLTLDEQNIAAEIFSHLITPSRERYSYTMDDLVRYTNDHRDSQNQVQAEQVASLLEKLSKGETPILRIVRPSARDPEARERYKVASDVLASIIRDWGEQDKEQRQLYKLDGKLEELKIKIWQYVADILDEEKPRVSKRTRFEMRKELNKYHIPKLYLSNKKGVEDIKNMLFKLDIYKKDRDETKGFKNTITRQLIDSIVEFQRRENLVLIDGIVGPETLKRLRRRSKN